MDKWQPIETAPKDGTMILIYEGERSWMGAPSGRIQVAKWLDGEWGSPASWCVQLTNAGNDRYPATGVSHWMPLPDPPKL